MSKLRQAAEELSRAWKGPSMSEMILAFHAMDAALAEDRLAEYMPPKRDERMTFNEWWNLGEVSGNNPYRHESAGWWAWEGWQAGVKAEREACAKVCDRIANLWPRSSLKEGWRKGYIDGGSACRNLIRERGQE